MITRTNACLLPAMLLVASAVGAETPKQNPSELVQQLTSDDVQVRAEAKAQLIKLQADAVESLVRATCGDPAPDEKLVDATLAILAHWEEQSWTDPASEAAIDKFVEMVRDPKNCAREHLPLSPDAKYPFAEAVRVLDVAPDDAAKYLRAKQGIKISQTQSLKNQTTYRSVNLARDWVREPKDWLYIANLAREIPGTPYVNGKRFPIWVDVNGPLEDDTLVECIKYLRKSKSSPFSLGIGYLSREALLLLKSYPHLRSLSLRGRISARQWDADITDEDWAEFMAACPDMLSLQPSPTAGRQTIAAAAKMEHLISLEILSDSLTEADLEPLRNHKTLQVLSVLEVKPFVNTSYINQDETGIWQRAEEKQSD